MTAGKELRRRCVACREQLHGDTVVVMEGERQLRNSCIYGNTVVVMKGREKAAALLWWTGERELQRRRALLRCLARTAACGHGRSETAAEQLHVWVGGDGRA